MKLKKIYKYDEKLRNTYAGIQTDNGIYWRSEYFKDKYGVKWCELVKALGNGLLFIRKSNQYYVCEKDFHDYYAGKIGNDVNQI